jgi:hypothetical protein
VNTKPVNQQHIQEAIPRDTFDIADCVFSQGCVEVDDTSHRCGREVWWRSSPEMDVSKQCKES